MHWRNKIFIQGAISRRLLLVLALILILFIGIYFWPTRTTSAAVNQPMPFPHQVMVGVGIDCLFCHADAVRSPAAGMPSVQKCMGCHKVIAANTQPIQTLTSYWEQQKPIPWKRVYQLPRFVYFSHEVHINAGLNCERCHGDVAHMNEAQKVVEMDMGWCLKCHNQQSNARQLRDCVVCHQ